MRNPLEYHVENGAAHHTHDTSFVHIASGGMLLCGFGYALRIQAYGSGFGRLVYTFGRALRMQECAIVLGSCSFPEKQGEGREHCKGNVRDVGPAAVGEFVPLLSARECSRGKERLTWSSAVPHGWIWCLCD